MNIRIRWFKTVLVISILQVVCVALANEGADQLQESPRHQEWVKISTQDGLVINAYLVFPEIKEKAASVIIIHENRGLTDWLRSIGDKLAAEGFVAICPDLLSGTGPEGGGTKSFPSSDAARKAIYDLNSDDITKALEGKRPPHPYLTCRVD